MATLWLIHTEVLLIYFFTTYQEVSPSVVQCGSFMCYNDHCCFPSCCSSDPFIDARPVWFVPVAAIFGTMACFICLLVVCIGCCKACKKSNQPTPQEQTRNRPIPIPPTLPTAPSLMQAGAPPPYSEVAGKPYFYPAPVEQPPCYDNIAMENLSSLDISQHPRSIPMDNS